MLRVQAGKRQPVRTPEEGWHTRDTLNDAPAYPETHEAVSYEGLRAAMEARAESRADDQSSL